MEEEKNLLNEVAGGDYDSSDRPFDFVEADAETALICEPDENVQAKLVAALTIMGYQTTVASSARDALKAMRFHLFDLVAVDEKLDTPEPERNDVLAYLETLAMATRRQIFVALMSDKYRTMDSMAAFNKSVNVIISKKNADDLEVILRRAVSDDTAFYRVMKDTLKKMDKI